MIYRNVADDVLFQKHFADLDSLDWFSRYERFCEPPYCIAMCISSFHLGNPRGIVPRVSDKFMVHSAVWGHSPVQRQNTNTKKLTIEKLSKSGLGRCTKFGQAHSSNERKITFVDFAFYMGFPDLIWVTSSAENIDLTRKRKLGPK